MRHRLIIPLLTGFLLATGLSACGDGNATTFPLPSKISVEPDYTHEDDLYLDEKQELEALESASIDENSENHVVTPPSYTVLDKSIPNEIPSQNPQPEDSVVTLTNSGTTTAEKESDNLWLILLGWSFGIAGLAIAIVANTRISGLNSALKKQEGKLRKYKQDIDFSTQSKSVAGPVRQTNSTTSLQRSLVNEMERRLSALELELAQIKRSATAVSIPQPPTTNQYAQPVQPAPRAKTGYFGTVISGEGGKGYFKRVFETKDGDARFEAKITDNTAEFTPIASLPTIKSNDYMDLAVDFQGASKAEAVALSTVRPGKAVRNGDKWIVETKAIVALQS